MPIIQVKRKTCCFFIYKYSLLLGYPLEINTCSVGVYIYIHSFEFYIQNVSMLINLKKENQKIPHDFQRYCSICNNVISIQKAAMLVYGSLLDWRSRIWWNVKLFYRIFFTSLELNNFYTLKMNLLRIILLISNLPKYSLCNEHVFLLRSLHGNYMGLDWGFCIIKEM